MELGVDALQIGRGLLFSRNFCWIRSRSLSRRKRLLHHCRLLDLGFEMVIDGLGKLGGGRRFFICSGSQVDLVGARLLPREIGFESVGLLVAQGEIGVVHVGEKQLQSRSYNRSVIIKPVIDGAGLNERRDQNRGNAHTQAREIKWGIEGCRGITGPFYSVRIRDGGRRHVIVKPAMLIVDDYEQSGVSHLGISPNGFESPLNERLARFYIVIGMLVAGGKGRLPIAARRIRKAWLEETIRGKIIVIASRKKIVNERAEKVLLPGKPVESRCHRGIMVVDDRVQLVFS